MLIPIIGAPTSGKTTKLRELQKDGAIVFFGAEVRRSRLGSKLSNQVHSAQLKAMFAFNAELQDEEIYTDICPLASAVCQEVLTGVDSGYRDLATPINFVFLPTPSKEEILMRMESRGQYPNGDLAEKYQRIGLILESILTA